MHGGREPAGRFQRGAEARVAGTRTGQPHPGYRCQDDVRVLFPQGFVVETEPVEHATSEVLYDDIRTIDELEKPRLA